MIAEKGQEVVALHHPVGVTGTDRFLMEVSRLTGKDLVHPTVADCAKVGQVLARIHIAGQTYTGHMDNPRGPTWWKAVMPDVLPFLDATDAAEPLVDHVC